MLSYFRHQYQFLVNKKYHVLVGILSEPDLLFDRIEKEICFKVMPTVTSKIEIRRADLLLEDKIKSSR